MKRDTYIIILLLGVLFLVILIFSRVFLTYLDQRQQYSENEQEFLENFAENMVVQNISYTQAQELPDIMEDLVHMIDEEENQVFFEDMYRSFSDLDSYEAYKNYITKYPELLPVLYAVRLQDKDIYQKFYAFIYEKVKEEEIYFADIKDLLQQDTEEGLKEGFVEKMGEHYDKIVSGNFSFSPEFGDGPLHIALTSDTIGVAKENCNNSGISGKDEYTREECYSYIYQYRAQTLELCNEILSLYQRKICKGFLEYIAQ